MRKSWRMRKPRKLLAGLRKVVTVKHTSAPLRRLLFLPKTAETEEGERLWLGNLQENEVYLLGEEQ